MNPWEKINLDTYEKHMRLDSVRQLQTINKIMKSQFDMFPVQTAIVLGVAGGNGLEHIRTEKYSTVYGVDINQAYLLAAAKRFPELSDVLKCLRIDLLCESEKLPHAHLLIANLLIEYIGYSAFQNAVLHVSPHFVSCVIQINDDAGSWVSDSPYLHAFDELDQVHHQIDADTLTASMNEIGYEKTQQAASSLPNGKALIRLDFRKKEDL